MPLRRNRNPYAPQRQGAGIDWNAQFAASAAARAQVAAVEEEVRQAQIEAKIDENPLSQLVKRCHTIDLRQDAFDKRLGRIEEQVQTIIDVLRESRVGH
jgi:hypothetical protein